MKRLIGTIKKKGISPERDGNRSGTLPQGDDPEAVVVREVTAFCESGAPESRTAGEEYLHLPAIVDAAESSPSASKQAAATIRRFLSKEYNQRGYAQYNAVMLTRILTDNPAEVFTQNFDAKFVSTVKELLREGRDTSVQQILRETLDHFEAEKLRENETLRPLMDMWRKEKSKNASLRPPVGYGYSSQPRAHQHQPRQHRGLPPPDELAARIEEAKTTARLLVQTVQSTPQSELLANDLVKEFAERARGANKSIQAYMNCENPRPDPDTMLTLIETNDQLNIAMSKHQRALLQARKALGIATPSPQPQSGPPSNSFPMPQHQSGQNVYASPPQSERNYNTVSPPPRQKLYHTSPPVHDEEHFTPPPGPPPAARGATRNLQQTEDYENAYSAPEAVSGGRPYSNNFSSNNSTAAYGVGDNPFTDNAYSEAPQKPHELFDGSEHPSASHANASGGIASDQYHDAQHRYSDLYSARHQSQNPPQPANTTTTNYNLREGPSSANQLSTRPTSGNQSNPVSPIDDTNGASRGIHDLRL